MPPDEPISEPPLEEALKDQDRTSGQLRKAADAYYSAQPEDRANARADYIRAIQDDSSAVMRVARARKKGE